jgi:hypothetical protein
VHKRIIVDQHGDFLRREVMREQLKQRLTGLKGEFKAGEKLMAEIASREAKLRESLLRISGAIQVLEEELAKQGEASVPSSPVRAVV